MAGAQQGWRLTNAGGSKPVGTQNWSEVLTEGNQSGANDVIIIAGQKLGMGTLTPNDVAEIHADGILSSDVALGVWNQAGDIRFLGVGGDGIVTQYIYAEQTTGNEIDFLYPKIYNTFTTPTSGNLGNNLTNAKKGVVQKIYHQDAIEPTFPVGWVNIGSKTYSTSSVNIIFAEFSEGTRVEYWIG